MTTLAPLNDGQLIRQFYERLRDLENPSTLRVGQWVLSDKGNGLFATRPGAPSNLLTGEAGGAGTVINLAEAAAAAAPLDLTDLLSALTALLNLPGDLATFLKNLAALLAAIDPFSSVFDPLAAARKLIQLILNPTGLLLTAEQIVKAITGIDLGTLVDLSGWAALVPLLSSVGGTLLSSVIPGLDASKIISGVFGAPLVQPFIDAVSQGFGGIAGLGFTGLQSFLGGLPSLIDPLDVADTAVINAITATNWFVDLVVGVLGSPLGLGTGSLTLPSIGDIPLLGDLLDVADTGVINAITATTWFTDLVDGLGISGLGTGGVTFPGDIPLLGPLINGLVQSWGGSGTTYGLPDLFAFAQTIDPQFVVGVLGNTNIGDTVQSFTDTIVQNVQSVVTSGSNFGILGGVLGAMTNFLGYNAAGQAPAASIANITNINNLHISAAPVTSNVADGIDKTADGSFQFALWDGGTISVVEGTEQWAVIATPNGGLKEAIEFYGSYTGSLTGLWISIYAFNANNVAGTQQTVGIFGTGNAPTSFALTLDGNTTLPIPFGAPAQIVEAFLSYLPNIGPGNVSVCGGPYWYVVNFVGALAGTPQSTMTGTTTGGTGSFVAVNPTAYGSKTWLWTSNNLFDSPGVGNVAGWNYANIPNANGYFNSAQGEYFAAGISVAGSGTYNVAGQTHTGIGHPTAVPAFFGGVQTVWPSSQWSTVGEGSNTGSAISTASENHTFNGQENCLIVFANIYGGTAAITGATCNVNGVNVPMIYNSGNISPYTGDYNNLFVFAITVSSVSAGTRTVQVVSAGGSGTKGMNVQSIALGGVISVGAPLASIGNSTQATHGYQDSDHGQMHWVNAFASLNNDFTAYSDAAAANFGGTAHSYPMICGAGHGMGTSLSTGLFAANIDPTGGSSPWAGVTIPINTTWAPFQVNTETTPGYAQNIPFFGLCGNPGVSQISNFYYNPPQLIYFYPGTSGFDPADYPWANWFDLIIWGAAGAGASGGPFQGGHAGIPGSSAFVTLSRDWISGAPWTWNIASAPLGGVYPSNPGASGGTSSVVVPGWSTLAAAGGTGGSGVNGTAYGSLGAAASDVVMADAYGDVNTYPGGPGGANANAAGGMPGGAGAGGNSGTVAALANGGPGGAGFGYLLVYQ